MYLMTIVDLRELHTNFKRPQAFNLLSTINNFYKCDLEQLEIVFS